MNNLICLNVLKLITIFFLFERVVSANLQACTTPTFESGLCVPAKECPYVKELTQNYGSYEAIPKFYLKYVFKSKCSKENEPIQLCCKMPPNYVLPRDPITPENDPKLTGDLDYTKDLTSQLNPEGLSMLKQLKCGNDDGNRIAGGNETALGEFPWMALLRYDTPGEQFKCGGSLITDRHVLTATHCVNSPYYPAIGVRLGEHNVDTDPDCKLVLGSKVCMPPVEDFGIDKIILHPKYSEKRSINDVAVVKLDRRVVFKIHIKPVCLPITKPAYEAQPNKFTIAGWGRTEKEASAKSNVLLKAENMTREENRVCENSYAAFQIQINQKHLCVADLVTGRDSCKGDSGGPLFTFGQYSETQNTKAFIQYGLVSAGGLGCNLEQKFPGIYTNIITFLPWITNNIVY